MHVSATSLTRKTDVRDCCGKMTLQPASQEEAILLAYLHTALVFGGEVTVRLSAKANKVAKHKGSIEMRYK